MHTGLRSHLTRLFLLTGFLFFGLTNISAQYDDNPDPVVVPGSKNFKVTVGTWVGLNSIQKYGISADMYLGQVVKPETVQPGPPARNSYKGILLGGELHKGGLQAKVEYINVGYSLVGVVGLSAGLVYMNNNSYSRIRSSSELVGVQVDLRVMFDVRLGLMTDLDEGGLYPMFGFGIPIGPIF